MDFFRLRIGFGALRILTVVLPFFCFGVDGDTPANGVNGPDQQDSKPALPYTFVGIVVEELSPAFAAHLSGIIPAEQGLLVLDVTPDSPADKGGIKPHDILLKYDDQKLFTPEQLIKLVHTDKPGKKVSIELVRAAKVATQQITLGERPAHEAIPAPPPERRHSPRSPWFRRPGSVEQKSADQRPGWNSFDSMTLKKLDQNRFHASIQHTDKNGKLQKHEFEGTYDEIEKLIKADKDLMPNERAHLLRGLDLERNTTLTPLWPEAGFFAF